MYDWFASADFEPVHQKGFSLDFEPVHQKGFSLDG